MPKTLKRKSSRLAARIPRLYRLLDRLGPPPEEWLNGAPTASTEGLEYPRDYRDLVRCWRKALRWTDDLDVALSCVLAVAASTQQQGDQLWARIIGPPGSGKTRLCDAMTTNKKYCYQLGQQKGFHSGWRGAEGEDEDYSLLNRVNGMTMVTPEGDELLKSPVLGEILAQGRRVYDGQATASYKNRKTDRHYQGLRMTWVIAGTSSLRALNRSNLGDRFIDCVIERSGQEEEEEILTRVAYSALRSVRSESNGEPDTQMDPRMTRAYRMTAGYVHWLRNDGVAEQERVEFSQEMIEYCKLLGKYIATMRARPDKDAEEEEPEVEMPTRLTSQFIRLANCIAVVMNRRSVDDEVTRRLVKIAHDTCRGLTQRISQELFWEERGLPIKALALRLRKTDQTIRKYLYFMRDIGLVETERSGNKNVWRLTKGTRGLLAKVFSK